MAVFNSKKIWEIGIPLSDAWYDFATRQEQYDLKKLPTIHDKLQNKMSENMLELLEIV